MAQGRRHSPLEALGPLQLEGVRDMDKTVGDGSYATVKELDFHGLKCVGKKIHAILYNLATPREKVAMLERFVSECLLLSRLHHPCIVQFLGVYFEWDSQLPVMVMEYLHTTLSACLDQVVLPEEISYEILRDVIVGLRYLHEHSPPIIHRDLSANNVLLTPNMSAKISDLGVAKILDLTPARMGQMTQTQMPGTPCYMPPEAMVARPRYTNKVDIFSYGVMMVHILSGQWPIPGEAFREDPNMPHTIIPVSELDRRAEFLLGFSREHPLMGLIRRCLSNVQTHRPEAVAIHEHISTILAGLPASFSNRAEMLQQITRSHEENEALRVQVTHSSEENEALRAQVTRSHDEMDTLRAEVERLSVTTGRGGSTGPQQDGMQWRRCAELPVGMVGPQAVVYRGKVFIGAGTTDSDNDLFLVFEYDPERNGWSTLTPSPVKFFGLAVFQGRFITVGGISHHGHTGKVHRYRAQSREWEEYLIPMPTARAMISAITTESAIITCGGAVQRGTSFEVVTSVEVYTVQTGQWHTADPLPIPCACMTAATIAGICYLLGCKSGSTAVKTVLYTPVSSLVQKATSPPQQSTHQDRTRSLWNTLPDVPLYRSTAASLSGLLLAVGGIDDHGYCSSAIHAFVPSINSWVQLPGDLPITVRSATAITLPDNRLLVCGGYNNEDKELKSVYIGSVAPTQ